jgi:hypothetical protein
MCEPRDRARPNSPGQRLLEHLEELRCAAEASGRPHSPVDVDLSGICVALGLRGLFSWRVEARGEYVAYYLGSREMLMWSHPGRLWSVWEARDWTSWFRPPATDSEADVS